MADNTLRIGIYADTKGLNAGLTKAQTRLKAFGSKLSAVGSSLQTKLALPLVAGAGAAIKMAADFDKSMTKIKTLVGVAGDKVDGMSMQVKSLAQNAAVSSAEAADAMFFITSAGIRGAEAMQVLEASTKAAALGLGDTATIADLSTSALNAYGSGNISAAGATDVLTAAVREGKLEASELSSVMGQVLPVASNMGVQFHEVGAAFAAMSRTGTPAAQAATQLNAILMAIMKPTKQSAAAMKELSLSSDGLRQQIKEKGLLSVFKTLKEKSLENAEAFERVFGNVRALKGVLDLTGASAEMTNEIFDRMANTAGMTEKAFIELQKSSEFKLRKGLIQLKNSFADVGAVLMDSLLPLITNLLGFIQGLFISFQNLDPVTQQIAIGFGLLAAVLPTILSIGGAVLTMFAAMTGPIGLVVAAVTLLALRFNEVSNIINDFTVDIKTGLLNALVKIQAGFEKFMIRVETASKLMSKFLKDGFDADFSSIFKEQTDKLADISLKAGEEISNNLDASKIIKKYNDLPPTFEAIASKTKKIFGDLFNKAGIKAPTVPMPKINTPKTQDLGSIFAVKGNPFSKASEGVEDFAKKSTKSFSAITSSIKENTSSFNEMNKARDQTQQKLSDLSQTVGNQLSGAFSSLGSAMVQSLGLGEGALGSFSGAFITAAMDAIGASLAVATAAAIAGAAEGSFLAGPLAPIVLPALIAGGIALIKSAFSSNVPAFANGGIVSGPTLGLMGEYAGARSNPEVIAPLDKLKGMIGGGSQNIKVGGEFRIQGQDLVVALQRAEKNRSRIL